MKNETYLIRNNIGKWLPGLLTESEEFYEFSGSLDEAKKSCEWTNFLQMEDMLICDRNGNEVARRVFHDIPGTCGKYDDWTK